MIPFPELHPGPVTLKNGTTLSSVIQTYTASPVGQDRTGEDSRVGHVAGRRTAISPDHKLGWVARRPLLLLLLLWLWWLWRLWRPDAGGGGGRGEQEVTGTVEVVQVGRMGEARRRPGGTQPASAARHRRHTGQRSAGTADRDGGERERWPGGMVGYKGGTSMRMDGTR